MTYMHTPVKQLYFNLLACLQMKVFLPTTYVVRGKVMFSEVSVRMGGRVRPVQVLDGGGGGAWSVLPRCEN